MQPALHEDHVGVNFYSWSICQPSTAIHSVAISSFTPQAYYIKDSCAKGTNSWVVWFLNLVGWRYMLDKVVKEMIDDRLWKNKKQKNVRLFLKKREICGRRRRCREPSNILMWYHLWSFFLLSIGHINM